MPKGSRGQKRPADVIGCAVQVARLSVGLEAEELRKPPGRVRSGHAGAKTPAHALAPQTRRQIARKAAATRWGHAD